MKFWGNKNFEIFVIFKFWQFLLNGLKYCEFFFGFLMRMTSFIILVEFEVGGMRPNEITKNGRIGAYGLTCKIFVNFELIFEIYDKNYPIKKIFMSLRQFWNFRDQTCPTPVLNIAYVRSYLCSYFSRLIKIMKYFRRFENCLETLTFSFCGEF